MCNRDLQEGQRVWCSKRCNDRWRWSVPSRKFVCPACGRTVLIPANKIARRKYCDNACARRAVAPPVLHGKANGNWRGGQAYKYGPGWKEAKERVRERDKVCQHCGKTPEENGRALDVHHINPHRNSKDNSLENLVALCRSCHMRAIDRGRRGAARFCGPEQLELKPLSQREQIRIRGYRRRKRRQELMAQAFELDSEGQSLRQIARALGVSHQTIAIWLATRESSSVSYSVNRAR